MKVNEVIKTSVWLPNAYNSSLYRTKGKDCVIAYKKKDFFTFILIQTTKKAKAYLVSEILKRGREIDLNEFFELYYENNERTEKEIVMNDVFENEKKKLMIGRL